MRWLGGYRPSRLGEDAVSDRDARARHMRWLLAGAGVLILLAFAAYGFFMQKASRSLEQQLADNQAESRRAVEELSVARLALDVERATRLELERQLADINDQLKKRKAELEFLKSRGAETVRQ